MSRRTLRSLIAASVLIITAGVFSYYITTHPETFDQLGRVSVGILALLFGLYAVFIVTLIWIQRATLALCNIHLPHKQSAILMAYSSIINFFGPLQSGPAFRAAYLKKQHNINLKQYTLATLLYYFCYAVISGMLLLAFVIGWWSVLAVVTLALVILLVTLTKRDLPLLTRLKALKLATIGDLVAATFAQVFILSVIYMVELRSLSADVSYFQVLAYTGAANFALFVSLTPGAIGFRESFLLFSQQIHGVSNVNIVAASLVDRGVYVAFLGLLALIVFGFHIQNQLKPKD